VRRWLLVVLLRGQAAALAAATCLLGWQELRRLGEDASCIVAAVSVGAVQRVELC
jgi:hypothetical protein